MTNKQLQRGQGTGARGQGKADQGLGFGVHQLRPSSRPTACCQLPTRPAFTLTELLIVIAIMAVLAGLITAAAVNAMRSSQRSAIVLDIKNISGALENFKNDYGSYPPNGMNPAPAYPPATGSLSARVQSDFRRMFKSAFQQSKEPPLLIDALAGFDVGTAVVTSGQLPSGMSAAEALVFWLGGFSDDPQYPISGPGGPSFATNDPTNPDAIENLESRKWRYQFDITQLGPRNDDGAYDEGTDRGRFVRYLVDLNNDGDTSDVGEQRRINLWRYTPGSSEQPLLYFDCSRYKPNQYDMWAANPTSGAPLVFAMKQLRSGVTTPASPADIAFVDQGKFQILHCGLDDAWGDDFKYMGSTAVGGAAASYTDYLLYPKGPFIGEIADTLTSFADGTIADATEE